MGGDAQERGIPILKRRANRGGSSPRFSHARMRSNSTRPIRPRGKSGMPEMEGGNANIKESSQNLRDLIESKITERGTINFAEFMETALYHPELGYYSKNAQSQDYYTNADVHPVFGRILAAFLKREFEDSFRNEKNFRVAELGAGVGKLCRNVLDALREIAPAIYDRCSYLCVERSPARRKVCEEAVKIHPNLVQIKDDFDF